jgi:hypothetical protein
MKMMMIEVLGRHSTHMLLMSPALKPGGPIPMSPTSCFCCHAHLSFS